VCVCVCVCACACVCVCVCARASTYSVYMHEYASMHMCMHTSTLFLQQLFLQPLFLQQTTRPSARVWKVVGVCHCFHCSRQKPKPAGLNGHSSRLASQNRCSCRRSRCTTHLAPVRALQRGHCVLLIQKPLTRAAHAPDGLQCTHA